MTHLKRLGALSLSLALTLTALSGCQNGASSSSSQGEEPIDLALRVTDTPPPGLAGRPLATLRHLICASPRYLAERGHPQHPRDLEHHACITLGEDERDRHWRFERAGEAAIVLACHGGLPLARAGGRGGFLQWRDVCSSAPAHRVLRR